MALLLVAGGCWGGGSSDPSPLPTIEASPPPPDVPLDLDVADKLLHDGAVDGAIAVYNAVAESVEGPERQRALSSLGAVLYDEGRFAESGTAVTTLLDTVQTPEERGRALLLLGTVQRQLGDTGAAREVLGEYIELGGAATAQAHLQLGLTLAGEGDTGGAIEELELALAEAPPPAQATEALFALGRAQETAERFDEALATRQRLADEGATPFERGEALWELLTQAGRTDEAQVAQDTLVRLVQEYPWHPRSLEALNLTPYAAAPVPTSLERGLVFFEHGLDAQAASAFETSIQEDASAASEGTAYLKLALLSERADENDMALERYDAALAALAGAAAPELIGEVTWEQALLLEALGRTEEAIAAYASLADVAPAASLAPESLFRAGFLRYQQGLAADASVLWTRYLELATGEDVARARFWLAKAAIAAGDTASADAHLAAAAAAEPWDYYTLRAAALVAGEAPLALDESAPEVAEADWTAVEEWLTAWAGPEDDVARQAFEEGVPLRRGLELLGAGLADEAQDQFDGLRNDDAAEPWLMYRLTRALVDESQTEAAARTAARLIEDHPDAPRELLRVAYPSDYLDLATAEAAPNRFPPLLMLALIRQESYFRPDAESSAGALGLTQVIPTTAEEIAGQLGEEGFVNSDLFRPLVSLRFGGHYLGRQLEFLAGDVSAALAAYNGGPGNAQRWQEAAAGDPDVFLEAITLSETRAYVELVLEHYARYRYAYGLTETASLALG
ncbi:MAG: lytic transglycosylase domain-containing protein [Dehalococcoidia bacterium]